MGDWDEENRLVSVTTTATGHRTEYVYDGLGRRVGIKEFDPDATQTLQTTSDKKYLWVGTTIAEERTGDDGGTVTKRFFAHGFVDNDGTILLYTRDHLGSTRELVDMSQTVRARYDYDPYGNVTKVSGDRESVFLYTGHFWDGRNGLYLTLFRAYDPVLGRWISRDPIGEMDDVNLYAYVGNAPVDSWDPLGLWNAWAPGTWGVPSAPDQNSWNPFDESAAWDGFMDGANKGAKAFVDGFTPFWDPFEGDYDPCDSSLKFSRAMGKMDQEIALFLLGIGAASKGKNALAASKWFGKGSKLFGRGKDAWFVNKNDLIRLGWNWKGSAKTGTDVFRMSMGKALNGAPTWVQRGWNYMRHMDILY